MAEAGIVCACIAPHGSEVIPELAAVGAAGGGTSVGAPAGVGGPETLAEALVKFGRLARAMEEIGRRARRAEPNTIVVATPHNLRLDGGFTAVVTAEFTAGTLAAEAPGTAATVEASFPVDRELARDIADRARAAGIPVAGVNYGALGGPNSLIPMDWGALIPLYFMGNRTKGADPMDPAAVAGPAGAGAGRPAGPVRVTVGPWEGAKVVLIGPSRDVPRQALVSLGEVVAEAAAASGRRVAFVASCDHGHAHLAGGPYGYDPASAVYDSLVCDIVKAGALERLLDLDPELVEAAKPDSLWQMLILLGVLRKVPLAGEFLLYEVPTYFGMLCAYYGLAG